MKKKTSTSFQKSTAKVSNTKIKADEGLERFQKRTEFQIEFNSILQKVIKPSMAVIGKKLNMDNCMIRGCTEFEESISGISPVLLKTEHVAYYILPKEIASGVIFIIAGNPLIQKVAVEFHDRHEILSRREYELDKITSALLEKAVTLEITSLRKRIL